MCVLRERKEKLTIVRLDTLEILLPTQVLTVDLAHIGDEEGILITGVAGVVVDALDALLQGTTNHLLSNRLAGWEAPEVQAILIKIAERGIGRDRLYRQRSILLEGGSGGGGRCHSHAAGCF